MSTRPSIFDDLPPEHSNRDLEDTVADLSLADLQQPSTPQFKYRFIGDEIPETPQWDKKQEEDSVLEQEISQEDEGQAEEREDQRGVLDDLEEPARSSARRPEYTREQRLENAKVKLKSITQSFKNLNEALEAALPRMQRLNDNIAYVDKLTAAYAEMMAQTEHTVQLLLDPNWQGADNDEERLREEEEDEARRQEEAERQRALEHARREAEERRLAVQADKDRRAPEAPSRAVRGVRRGMRGPISRARERAGTPPEKGTASFSRLPARARSGIARPISAAGPSRPSSAPGSSAPSRRDQPGFG